MNGQDSSMEGECEPCRAKKERLAVVFEHNDVYYCYAENEESQVE